MSAFPLVADRLSVHRSVAASRAGLAAVIGRTIKIKTRKTT